LSIIFIVAIVGFTYFKITDIQLEKEIKEIHKKYKDEIEQFKIKRENRDKTLNRLTEALTSLCRLLNIDISYHDYLDIAAGRILYKSINGRLLVNDAKIQILNKCKDEPYVLAHELGHYMAIKQREDDTEEGADTEALNICKTILTPEEQSYIADELRIFFESKIA
jgi:Zn-dependent peptidase ImmA (M78 family)